jgi:hypothetical protein
MTPNGYKRMIGKPLSAFSKPVSRQFSLDTLQKRPEFANPIADALLITAQGEQWWSILLARLLGASAEVTTAAYLAVPGDDGKRKVLWAAANTRLDDEHFGIYWAVQRAWSHARDDRNVFAHCIAGWSPNHERIILFANPEKLSAFEINCHLARFEPGREAQIAAEDILYYRLEDAQKVVAELRDAAILILRLSEILDLLNTDTASPRIHFARNTLCQHPHVCRELEVYERLLAKNKVRPK